MSHVICGDAWSLANLWSSILLVLTRFYCLEYSTEFHNSSTLLLGEQGGALWESLLFIEQPSINLLSLSLQGTLAFFAIAVNSQQGDGRTVSSIVRDKLRWGASTSKQVWRPPTLHYSRMLINTVEWQKVVSVKNKMNNYTYKPLVPITWDLAAIKITTLLPRLELGTALSSPTTFDINVCVAINDVIHDIINCPLLFLLTSILRPLVIIICIFNWGDPW